MRPDAVVCALPEADHDLCFPQRNRPVPRHAARVRFLTALLTLPKRATSRSSVSGDPPTKLPVLPTGFYSTHANLKDHQNAHGRTSHQSGDSRLTTTLEHLTKARLQPALLSNIKICFFPHLAIKDWLETHIRKYSSAAAWDKIIHIDSKNTL